MPLQFYQSFDINEKDFKELFCVECTKNGSSVDALSFCVGCESLFCYQCLQDHTRNDGNLEVTQKEDLMPSGYKHVSKSGGNSISNGFKTNTSHGNKPEHNLNQVTETKIKLLSLKKQLHRSIEHDKTARDRRFEKILEDLDEKVVELRTKVMKALDDFHSSIINEIKNLQNKMDQVYSEKERAVQILIAKTDAMLKHLQKGIAKNNTEEIAGLAEQMTEEAITITDDPNNIYAETVKKATKAETDYINTIFEQSMDDLLCNIYALGTNFLVQEPFKGCERSICQFYDIQAPTDMTECDINGCCVLSDGTIILADWSNTNIKHLNKTYQVTDICDLPGIPWTVCCSGREEVAVSLHLLQKIQFISLSGNKMIPIDSFRVKQKCRGVACAGNKVYVSCGGGGLLEGQGQIQVYARAGNLLEIFEMDSDGNNLFSCPQHISVTSDMLRLYVGDKNFGLITIDLQNKMPIALYDGIQTKSTSAEAKGICLIDNSNILQCDFVRNEVVLYHSTNSPEQSYKILLDKKDNINNPQSLSYNKNKSALIVTSRNSNLIQVFKIQL